MTQVIKGEEIYLKRLVPEDVTDRYVSWLNDTDVNKFLECRFTIHSKESVKNYIRKLSQEESNELFSIYRNEDSDHIGNIKIGPINHVHQHATIGLIIGEKKYWGCGYGAKAIRALSSHAFKNLSLESLNAGCYSENVGSYKAFIKAGWKITGYIKAHWKNSSGKRLDEILMSKTKCEEIEFPQENGITLMGAGRLLEETVIQLKAESIKHVYPGTKTCKRKVRRVLTESWRRNYQTKNIKTQQQRDKKT